MVHHGFSHKILRRKAKKKRLPTSPPAIRTTLQTDGKARGDDILPQSYSHWLAGQLTRKSLSVARVKAV